MKKEEFIVGVLLLLPIITYYFIPVVPVPTLGDTHFMAPENAIMVCSDPNTLMWLSDTEKEIICRWMPNIKVVFFAMAGLGSFLVLTNIEKTQY